MFTIPVFEFAKACRALAAAAWPLNAGDDDWEDEDDDDEILSLISPEFPEPLLKFSCPSVDGNVGVGGWFGWNSVPGKIEKKPEKKFKIRNEILKKKTWKLFYFT